MAIVNTEGQKTSAQHIQDIFERLDDPALYTRLAPYPIGIGDIYYDVVDRVLVTEGAFGRTVYVAKFDFKKLKDGGHDPIKRRIKRNAKRILTNAMTPRTDLWAGDSMGKHTLNNGFEGYLLPEDLSLDFYDDMKVETYILEVNIEDDAVYRCTQRLIDSEFADQEWEIKYLMDDLASLWAQSLEGLHSPKDDLLKLALSGRYDLLANSLVAALKVAKAGVEGTPIYNKLLGLVNALRLIDTEQLQENMTPEHLSSLKDLFHGIKEEHYRTRLYAEILAHVGVKAAHLVIHDGLGLVQTVEESHLSVLIRPEGVHQGLLRCSDLSRVVIASEFDEGNPTWQALRERGARFIPVDVQDAAFIWLDE